MKKFRPYILAAMAAGCFTLPVMADDYYDDLYAPVRPAAKKTVRVPYGQHDYPSADQYADQASGTLRMDVDRYNRRGSFLVGEPQQADTLGTGDTFAYTRRIERYHNPEVVTESGDTTLVDYYYTAPAAQNVNIYVVDNTPSIYYNWAWRYGNPWYWNVYGPAYVGWGGWGYSPYWDPYWSYGYHPYWNYGWGWGWDPYWDYGWGWGHSHWGGGWYPGHNYQPTSSGAYRPHGGGSSTGIAGRNPGSSTRPSGNDYGNTGRPGNMGRPTYSGNYNTAAGRPGTAGTATARPGTRPSTSQGTYTPYGAGSRGRNASYSGGSTYNRGSYSPSSSGSYTGGRYSGSSSSSGRYSSGSSSSSGRNSYNSSSSSSSSRSSYNSSSSSSSSSSRSSYSSGSHSSRGGGSSSGGGSYSGGGGRGRR